MSSPSSGGSGGFRPADPATLGALAKGRVLARDLSDALLTHVPDLGDLAIQRAVDAWVEQAADTLRALSEALEERLIDLGSPPSTSPSPAATTTSSASSVPASSRSHGKEHPA